MNQRIHARIPGARVYMVGGAVRDNLLDVPVQDHDWVVVGATPDMMVEQGYLPVGKDFPVFLHPDTHEEHALARTERKTARGYKGFAVYSTPDVTLEQDLARRDLTINAIALDEDGELVDPYHGQRDLQHKVLRHVTEAFAEDPVRILRVARFAARFSDFTVAPETLELMSTMVHNGEVDHLVAERVWQELSRGLMEQRPSRMLPEVHALWGVPQRAESHPEVDTGEHLMLVLDMAARLQAPLTVRYACLCHDLGKATTPPEDLPRHPGHEARSVDMLRVISERLRVPTHCRELAEVVAREHGCIHGSLLLNAKQVVQLLERCDAFRQPQRFSDVLLACECDARGRLGHADAPYLQAQRLLPALELLQGIPKGAIARAIQEDLANAAPEIRRTAGFRIRAAISEKRHLVLAASGLLDTASPIPLAPIPS